jgi:putative serine protease PepD
MSDRKGLWTGEHPDGHRTWAAPRRRRAHPASEPPPPQSPPDRRSVRRIAVIAALAGAILLGAVIGGVSLLDDDGPGDASAPVAVAPGKTPQTNVGRVYAAVERGVVSVRAGNGSGTGFLVDGDGTIVTNSHVVGSADSVSVRFGENGARVGAEVLGRDVSTDLAILRVDRAALGNARPLTFADSDDVRVGDDVVAVGHPFGLDRTATSGIVSGLGREIQAPNGFQIDEVIQTDAAINPGNSGGPLVDARGRVIGVNSQIATAGAGGNVGVGFAVPSNTVRQVLPRLSRGQSIDRAYLGVTTSAAAGGAAVEAVVSGGPAGRAGLRPGSDVIVGIEGRTVREPDDVARAIANRKPGDKLTVTIERDGDRRDVEVTLGKRP